MEEELIHELAAGYALDALTPEEERAFEEHLRHCPRCREELAGFSELAASLGFAAPEAAPPPGLRERILSASHAETAPVVTLRPRWAYAAVAAAAVAASAAIGLGVWAATLNSQLAGRPPAERAVPLRGATGALLLTGSRQATLVVSGLPHAAAGKTYEVWVIQSSGAEPAGLFAGAVTTSVVRLSRSVPAGARVGVTLEPAGGSARPTSAPLVLSARA